MSTIPQLPDEVIAALRDGHKIEAIKLLRESHGIGLKQAKELVEMVARGQTPVQHSSPAQVPDNPPLIESGSAGSRIGRILFVLILLGGGLLFLRDLLD